MERLLDSGREFSAVFAATDSMALGCLGTLQRRGISVPQQISLAGFDNVPVTEYVHPPLTTVDLHMRSFGAAAIDRLLALLEGTDTGPLIRLHSTELVVRDSTGPPATLH